MKELEAHWPPRLSQPGSGGEAGIFEPTLEHVLHVTEHALVAFHTALGIEAHEVAANRTRAGELRIASRSTRNDESSGERRFLWRVTHRSRRKFDIDAVPFTIRTPVIGRAGRELADRQRN